MRYTTHHLIWNDFEKIVKQNSYEKENKTYNQIIYRGHASESWDLRCTLGRLLGHEKDLNANVYYQAILDISPIIKIGFNWNHDVFLKGTLCANDEHIKVMRKAIFDIITLRHLGFPTPILDWTNDADIAAFFSFINNGGGNAAIYCLKKKDYISGEQIKKIDGLDVFKHEDFLDLNFGDTYEVSLERHKHQKAAYTCCIYDKNPYGNTGSFSSCFSLKPLEKINDADIDDKKIVLTKYIITDSCVQKLKILKFLYEKGISYTNLYGKTHIEENTNLKDIAIQKLLFSSNG
jgi:hypothetical protein